MKKAILKDRETFHLEIPADENNLGEVRDFIDLHIYNLHWPIFNVADSAITIGIILLAYELLIVEPKMVKVQIQ